MAVNARGKIITGGAKERKLVFQNIRSNYDFNTWASKADMPPSGNNSTSAAVVDGIIYCMSGRSNSFSNHAYNPATDTWTAKQLASTGRNNFTIAAAGEIIYCVGGYNDSGILSLNEAYDLTTDTWTVKQPMPTSRYDLTAASVGGIIYCIGGTMIGGSITSANEAYDPITDTWTAKQVSMSLIKPATTVVDGIIYCIGGGGTAAVSSYNRAYNPATNTWASKADMPTARQSLAAASVDGIIYCIGGYASYGSTSVNEAYNIVTNKWTTKANMPQRNRYNLAAVSVNENIFCIGGYDSSMRPSVINQVYTPYIKEKHIMIINDALSKFDKVIEWNGEEKPANVEFETTGQGILSFPVTGVSGTVTEKIEKEIIITKL